MNLELAILIFTCLLATAIEYYMTKRLFTPTTMLGWPYICVIILNRIVGENYGFIEINNNTIQQINLGILFFLLGSVIAIVIKNRYYKSNNSIDRNVVYNMKRMYVYVMIVAIVTFVRLIIYILRYGMQYFLVSDGVNGILMTGVLCHLLLSTYPLIPILVAYAIKKKSLLYSIPVILILFLTYFTFVKYHIISLILIIIIYINIENKSMFYKTLPVLLVLPVCIFFMNYIMNFHAREIQAETEFLLNHLFNYLSGGLIYNSIDPGFTYNNYGIIELIIMFFMVIPNLFLNALFNVKFYDFQPLAFLSMGSNNEYGNVLNTISFLFSSKNLIGTFIVIVCWGFLVSSISSKSKGRYPLMSVVYSFTLLSFYATFLVLAPPWEMIIFSLIVPNLFLINKKQQALLKSEVKV